MGRGGFIKIIDNTEILKDILENTEIKEEITKLLENILNKPIKKYEYLGMEKFENIVEYNFKILKINITFENNVKEEAYIRLIEKGKIKESIFCYWSLLYDKFNDKDKKNFKDVKIKEKLIQKDKKSIILQNDKYYNFNIEINLIELKKFFIEKLKEDEKLKKLIKYLNKINNEILFLGIIQC